MIKPGTIVATPQGVGRAMNPCRPGHREGDWWVLFGIRAERFPVGQLASREEGTCPVRQVQGRGGFSSFSCGTGDGTCGAAGSPSPEGVGVEIGD